MLNESSVTSLKNVINSLQCEYAEIRMSAIDGTRISLSGNSIESISSGTSIAGSIRIFDRGNWSFISFNQPDEIDRYAARIQELSLKLATQPSSGIKSAPRVSIRKSTHSLIDFSEISLDEKFELVQAYNTILFENPKIQTTRSFYKDSVSQELFVNSEGSDMLYDKSHCGVALSAIAKDGSLIQPYYESFAGFGGYEFVNNRHSEAEQIVATALELLDAEQISGGRYQVVTDPRLTGVFIHEAFGHLSEADFVYENERMKEIMTLGTRFGKDELNVVDYADDESCAGYIPLDDEGVKPQKSYLIHNGMLSGRLHSRETAEKMDEELTGNGRAISPMAGPIVRMTNTYIENGSSSKDEIFDAVTDGVYAVNAFGGQTNLEMFTFSAAYGRLIKNGKPGKMVKNVMLSGNVFETLKNISMIGNDMRLFGGLGGCGKGGQSPLPVSFGGPHLVIDNVLIGGSQ